MNRFALVVALVLVTAGASVGAAHAQSKPAKVRTATAWPARRAAPGVLASAARTTRIKSALKAAGIKVGAIVQTLGMKLTPVVPRLANGAEITFAGPGVFMGADADEPDGAFLLQHASVRMKFPTTAQKVYVLDCRFDLLIPAPQMVTVTRNGGTPASIPVENGHLFHAFQASGSTTAISLTVVPPNSFPAGYFYGCDFGNN